MLNCGILPPFLVMRGLIASPSGLGLGLGRHSCGMPLFLAERLVPDGLGLFLCAAERLVRAARFAVFVVRHIRHTSPQNGSAVLSESFPQQSSGLPASHSISLHHTLPPRPRQRKTPAK